MNLEKLNDLLDEVVERHFKGLKFRKYQREIIIDILKSQHIDNLDGYILEAPTGSGKSIISMVYAMVNSRIMKVDKSYTKGYLVTSDKMLQEQYVDDIKRFNLDIPSVKGIENYICNVNKFTVKYGSCKDDIRKNLRDCYSTCSYYSVRDAAMKSNIALMNYSYHLAQLNFTGNFKKRDFIVCDEAHKIPSIVQETFSPLINDKYKQNVEYLKKDFDSNGFKCAYLNGAEFDINEINEMIDKIMTLRRDDYESIYNISEKLVSLLDDFLKISENYKKFLNFSFNNFFKENGYENDDMNSKVSTQYSENENKIYMLCVQLGILVATMTQYGKDTCVYNYDAVKKDLKLNNVMESEMVDFFLNKQTGFKLILSATLGNLDEFAKKCSFDKYKFKKIKLPSHWNFDKSPIYVFDSFKLNMSFKYQKENMKNYIDLFEQILNRHSEERGVIHTVSNVFLNEILKHLSFENKMRILTYSTSKEKENQIKKLAKTKNGILMGASLIEGLNLENDLGRFCIFAKVPYPNLTDELIKQKLVKYPNQYAYDTSLSIQQGVGRIVRNELDFGVTYFLDSSFNYFMEKNKNHFPNEFLQRLNVRKLN